jgi:outer membrane protein, heavy metal efflux system
MRVGCGVLALIVATGCVRFHPQPLSPSTDAQTFSARTLEDAGLRRFMETSERKQRTSWPPTAWGLSDLTLAALYYSPDLDVARAQWAVAQAAVRTAGERPNPTLTLTPGFNTTTRTPTGWIALGGLDIPIETAGKRGHRRAQAAQLAEAARLNTASAAWQLRGRVRSGLLALSTARETLSLLSEQERRGGENARIMEVQHQVGSISAFELTQGRIAAESARLAGHEARRQEAEARVSLAEAIGIPAQALEKAQFAFDALDGAPLGPTLDEARTKALLGRADILAALAEYAASQSGLQLEIAKQYPDIHLGPGYEYDQGDGKWSLGLAFDLPVFGRNRGAIGEALAKRSATAAFFAALQARVLAEVDRALAGYRAAIEKRSVVDAMLADLQKQEVTARAMLEAGEIGQNDLLALQIELGTQALARADAVTKSRQALGALEDAMQSGFGVPDAAWRVSARAPLEHGQRERR